MAELSGVLDTQGWYRIRRAVLESAISRPLGDRGPRRFADRFLLFKLKQSLASRNCAPGNSRNAATEVRAKASAGFHSFDSHDETAVPTQENDHSVLVSTAAMSCFRAPANLVCTVMEQHNSMPLRLVGDAAPDRQ